MQCNFCWLVLFSSCPEGSSSVFLPHFIAGLFVFWPVLAFPVATLFCIQGQSVGSSIVYYKPIWSLHEHTILDVLSCHISKIPEYLTFPLESCTFLDEYSALGIPWAAISTAFWPVRSGSDNSHFCISSLQGLKTSLTQRVSASIKRTVKAFPTLFGFYYKTEISPSPPAVLEHTLTATLAQSFHMFWFQVCLVPLCSGEGL